jgi:hypothetical protein
MTSSDIDTMLDLEAVKVNKAIVELLSQRVRKAMKK